MLDIQFIRNNPELVTEKTKQKGYDVDVEALLRLDSERLEVLRTVEALRSKRNDNTAKIKGSTPTPDLISEGKTIKVELSKAEEKYSALEDSFTKQLAAVPNMPLAYVPVGATENDSVVAKTVGEPTAFDFQPKQHWELAEPAGLIDKKRAAKIAGSRFAYIKGDLVKLQFAIIQFVLQTVSDKDTIERLIKENNLNLVATPFVPIIPPAMLHTEPYLASSRLDEKQVTYKIAQDDLWLNASAEHTLCTMYWNEILPEDMLPIRYIGYSTSFRREAGAYGKDVEGIFRLHQFDKLEMEIFSTAETGLDEHKLTIAIQEYLLQQLGIPYRLLQKCTADIGKPNAVGVDMEAWLPGQGKYRETHTADYMTDYQARDLKIRVRRGDNTIQFVHTNDATAFALGRIMIAIMENFQTRDGKIAIPQILCPYMGGQTII
jgi:seryl-tRNA synthetase